MPQDLDSRWQRQEKEPKEPDEKQKKEQTELKEKQKQKEEWDQEAQSVPKMDTGEKPSKTCECKESRAPEQAPLQADEKFRKSRVNTEPKPKGQTPHTDSHRLKGPRESLKAIFTLQVTFTLQGYF